MNRAVVTPSTNHHFFDYYDKRPCDSSNRLLLTTETDFVDRAPKPEDKAGIGIVEGGDARGFRRVAETYAWNFQQGAMLQWLSARGEPVFIHNDRRDGRFVAVLRTAEGHELNVLPHPVYHVSSDGCRALTLNFSRLARTRPGYGYAGVTDTK